MKFKQYITAGSQFDGLAQNAGLTSGGLFVLPASGSNLLNARIKKLQFKTSGVVASWIWAQRLMETGTLAYDAFVAAFTVGQTATGVLSGNTGLIVNDVLAAPNGVLSLGNLTGPFQNNEQITDPLGGDAIVNGIVTFDTVEIDDGITNDYYFAFADDEGFIANNPNGAVPGTPSPIVFTTLGMAAAGVAIIEIDYMRTNGNT